MNAVIVASVLDIEPDAINDEPLGAQLRDLGLLTDDEAQWLDDID